MTGIESGPESETETDPADSTAPAGPAGAGAAGAVAWLDRPPAGAALGGKADSLARILRAGLPVPPGFVILPAAFEPPDGGAADGQPAARLTAPAAAQVRAAYAALSRRLEREDPIVAVRSSASAEDLPGASFAGQYATYLGVRGAEAVVAYAGRCAASLWSGPALAYRRRLEAEGAELGAPAMAVVVQALIEADAAGVAFTADPLDGARGAVVVNAAWGLGQSVVDGVVEGDSWRVDRESLAVLHARIGDKPSRSGRTPESPRLDVVADDRRRCPAWGGRRCSGSRSGAAARGSARHR